VVRLVIRSAVSRAAGGIEAIGATAVALAVLATLVVAGGLSSIDQYAVDHWMPDFEPSGDAELVNWDHQFYPELGDPLQAFCNVWTFPASAFVSGVVLAVCCVAFVRRGQPRAALAWAAAWTAANVVELILKLALHKPALNALEDGVRVSFDNFSHSFPSGHALRAVMTAALLAMVWRVAARPALVWTAVALPALVYSAAHTPSDVLGGALLGLLAALSARTLIRTRAVAR
jgi:membrane-associated phospholipid phosphatase